MDSTSETPVVQDEPSRYDRERDLVRDILVRLRTLEIIAEKWHGHDLSDARERAEREIGSDAVSG